MPEAWISPARPVAVGYAPAGPAGQPSFSAPTQVDHKDPTFSGRDNQSIGVDILVAVTSIV